MKRCFDDASDPDETTGILESSCNPDSSPIFSCNFNACNFIGVRRKKSTPSEGEQAVVNDLNDLSAAQREEVFEEVHGVGNTNTIEESPEFIQDHISKLRRHMLRMTRSELGPYELASLLSPSFVNNKDFLLMFLRADMFDIKKAASRLIAHFKYKMELFGASKLVKEIAWSDFDETDRIVTSSCSSIHYPELQDNAGRTVWVAAMGHDKEFTDDGIPLPHASQLRYAWYSIMGFINGNQHAQKHGIVGVGYMIGKQNNPTRPGSTGDATKLIMAMPYRYAALHVCYDDPKLKPALNLVQLYANYQTRVRFRLHFGTHVECQYSLMSFGLDQKTFPIDDAGNLRTQKYLEYLESRKHQEAQSEAEQELRYEESGVIDYPASNDVLFGRGKSYSQFEGNVRMYALIDRYKGQYLMAATKDEKTVLAEMVLIILKGHECRFLKRVPKKLDGWMMVTDAAAREKISQTFRTRLK